MLRSRFSFDYSLFFGSLAALTYGLVARLVFKRSGLEDYLGLITLGFVVLVPIAIGALTVVFAPRKYKTSLVYGFFAPWLPCLLLAVIVGLLQWEVAFCILMAVPIFLIASSVGGFVTALVFSRLLKDQPTGPVTQASLLGFIVLAPYLLTPIEHQFTPPTTVRTVETRVAIQAEAETVWRNIIAVPEITPAEHHPTLFRLLGLPTPMEATLSEAGIGGMRYALYDNGLVLLEPVTVWEPSRRYAFGVQLDPASPSPPPFEQVGGRYFEVRQVSFTIEPAQSGGVVLYLRSQYRLSTWLNPYGQWWLDLLLQDLQNYILGVIQGRAEGG